MRQKRQGANGVFDQEELVGRFGQNFRDFGEVAPGMQVVYALSNPEYPIGNICDPSTPPGPAREIINQRLSGIPIYHLGVDEGSCGQVAIIEDQLRRGSKRSWKPETIFADGLIVCKEVGGFAINCLMGDCALLVVSSPDNCPGYTHIGRAAFMGGILRNFFWKWPSRREETHIWLGPCIAGKHFHFTPVPDEFKQFACTTIWGTQGFDLHRAIVETLQGELGFSPDQITDTGIDPYAVVASGDKSWAASDQWYRKKGSREGLIRYSPRNSTFLFVGECP